MAKIVLTISADNKATQSVKLLNAEVQTLSKTLSSIKVNKNLTTQINALTKHYKAVADAHAKIIVNKNKEAIADEKLRLQQEKTATQIAKTNTEISRQNNLNARTEKTTYSLAQAKEKATQATQKQTSATKQGTKANEEHRQSILSMTRGILEWQIATTLVMKPLRMLQNALQSINDTLVKTEDAVIALQRVLPSGSASDSEISSRLYKIAQDYGQTFENVQQIAQNFARTGMSWADTIKATEAAVLALNVAELNAEEATTGLIAILSQFRLEASDLESVIDKLNKTADNFPVTTEKILAALQRTGSAASNANLSLEETISLITALSKATGRSGENIGTALNSLIQYSRKDSALEVFAGLSDESAAVVDRFRKGAATILDVWQQVSKEIQSLDSRQADLLDSYFNTEDGQSLSDALDGELEDIYTEMAGVYDTANTFRKNYFIALLGNMDTVLQAQETLSNAAGYSQKENEKYLQTYTARQNSVQAKWQKIANDAQGILGLKKNLLDVADVVLTILNYTGKLNTVFFATGAILAKLYGAKVAEYLAKQITSWSHLSRVINAQAKPAVINYTAEIKRLKAEIFSTVDSETLLAKQTELLALKQQRLATVLQGVSSAVSVALIVFTALNTIQGIIDQAREDRLQAEQEELEKQNEKIAKSVESIATNKELAQSTSEYAERVKELREILDSSTASENEKQSAQNKLLAIQNALIESNNDYASSLDLINGKLSEQLNLVERMSDAELKKQAQQFLDDNYAQIADANRTVNGQSNTTVSLLEGTAFENSKNKDIIWQIIEKAREQGIDLSADNNVSLPAWVTPAILGENIRKAANGENTSVWDWLGFSNAKAFFTKEGWTGTSWAGLTASGTVDEQIESLQAFRQLIIDNYADLGLTYKDSVSYIKNLDDAIAKLNTTEYQNAKTLAEKAKATEDFIAGTISREEYLKSVYGIESDIVDEEEEWHNNIAKVTSRYDKLISKLEELRDLNKEAYDWEEKKLAVLEAEQALENARNEATVRRFNEDTNQWEWQTDEKAIKEAEENLEKARLNLEEAAYNNIIDQLKKQKENSDKVIVTNESILAVLEEVAPLLGEDFASAVQKAIQDTTGVDLSQPIVSEEGSYDSGGIANGLGYMPKATAQPETVNNPELTAKILSPVSNAQFDKYVRDMGIMFETARQYSHAPIIERIGGATDNRVDNSGQITMNGVTIGSDRRGNSLDELLILANIIPKA